MVKIDLKDRKLLHELDLNSRQPIRELARKIGLSKNAAIYRLNKLCRLGVIKKFQTLVDVGKLGYISFKLYIKLQNVSPRKEREIINYLKCDKRVLWIVSVEDGWDINTWIVCKTIHEMNDLWKTFTSKYRNYLDKKRLNILTKVTYFSNNYMPGGVRKSFVFITEPKKVKIDRKSEGILRVLVSNSRTSNLEIGGKLGISSKTVAKKIREMEKEGIISCHKLMLDLGKIGYKYYKIHILMHNVTPEKEERLRDYVSNHVNVVYTSEVLGGDDIEIELYVKSVEELREFISDIKEKFTSTIRSYEIMLYYEVHKYVGLPV
jgi:DNA-binding Lrp family transcriptional regulator